MKRQRANYSPKAETRVYAFISKRGDRGATDEEIHIGLKMNPSTERPRRVDLVDAGQVYDSGRTRETKAGIKAKVWVVSTM